MNGVLSATRIMKGHEVRKRCAEAKNSPTLLLAMELEAKRRIYEMNREVIDRREVS
ncbi:hypothetical protein P4J13_28195 [Bacillus anthracis]|uniref:hypothetical protein n=1 Tax=Bacillus TaxID=1386 RepID=UPI001BB41076|nr:MULTISPECIES: hypothetical protein [Bacillus]MEB9507777.1 hypothetical protein [Bacillus anthracis]